MPAYEQADTSKPAQFFEAHPSMPSAPSIDFTGDRVNSYMDDWLEPAEYMMDIQSIMDDSSSLLELPFNPKEFDKSKILDFERVSQSTESKEMFQNVTKFRNDAVEKWNPYNRTVTETNWLGLVGLDEARSDGTGAVVVDLQARAGMLDYDGNKFTCAEDIDQRWMLMFGDVKTVDNINLINDMIQKTNARGGLSDNSDQLDVFEKALDRLLDIPGDWHAGLAMLQSIFHLYFPGYLEQFKFLLKWKNYSKDCRKNYYQASRAVMFQNKVVSTFLFHKFIQKLDALRRKFGDGSDADFMYFIAVEFKAWLKALIVQDDQWLALNASFVLMSNDFLRFVKSYRGGDSIAIEQGYRIFCPIWRLNGQHRYYQRHWTQQEVLFGRAPFYVLQIIRRSRTTCRYANTKKGHLAKDECVEIGNLFLSKLPTPKDVANFAEKSVFVGPGRRCTLFTRMWNTRVNDENTDITQSAKMKFNDADIHCAFELLCLLDTSNTVPGRKFHRAFVSSQRENVTIDIKDKKVEQRIKEVLTDPAASILSTLRQCYDENRESATQVVVTENLSEEGEVVEEEVPVVMDVEIEEEAAANEVDDEDAARGEVEMDDVDPEADVEENTEEDGYNRSSVTDVWTRGRQLVEKDNIKQTRKGQILRQKRKRMKNRAMRLHIESQKSNIGNCALKEEADHSSNANLLEVLNKYSCYGDVYTNIE
jgi:hypothetical protein